jgi:hypothetical protein
MSFLNNIPFLSSLTSSGNPNDRISLFYALMTMIPFGQLWARIFWLDGSLDKLWLLLPIPFFAPPFSIIPALAMYFGFIKKGQGGPTYDRFMLIPIIFKFILASLVPMFLTYINKTEYEYDEDDEYDEDEEEYEEEDENGPHGIHINIGGFADNSFADRMKPKRHVMKKENEIVNKFFKLVTNPVEENTIDDQLDQFKKALDEAEKSMIHFDKGGSLVVGSQQQLDQATAVLLEALKTKAVLRSNQRSISQLTRFGTLSI